ncbi:ketopantoate reductase family protein [Haloplanus sp. GCM10025708]|uniref:ketopantoate reductase family protein n=1 Tax=Haloferacaceae TaxID=1644056 RepID=UPI00360DFA09
MELVVFGAGSLGSLVGALLLRVHDVTLVGRDPHVSAIRDAGLRVRGVESFVARPAATTDGTGLSADLALVTVKSFDTGDAASDLDTGDVGAVLSLQNGMGNEAVLADALSCPVLAGTATYGAVSDAPGEVEWRGGGDVVLGPWTDDADAAASRARDAFASADVPTTLAGDVRRRLWEKLAVNAAINPVTALVAAPNRALTEGPASDLAPVVARECARVARSEGVDLDGASAIAAVERVARETAGNQSSMRRDLSAGRRTEIDAITGYVVERADVHGISVPVNRTLLSLVHAWERERGHR